MKALILAAGKGFRFRPSGKPKVLERVLGLTLIERAILSAREAGTEECFVVVGHRGDEVIASLEEKQLGVRLHFIRNERWEEGNAYSVLTAKKVLKGERFFLLMGDHLFDTNILRRLRELKPEGCIVCVDSKPWTVYDREATKVLAKDKMLKTMKKGLERATCVDCGIFLCTDEIFDACEKTIAKGRDELSDAVRTLAARGSVKTFDIGDSFWFDVDTPSDLADARDGLLDSLDSPYDGIVSKYLNRRISTRISSFLAEKEISPNTISIFVFLVGALAALLFSLGPYLPLALGGIVAQVCSILDGCDGEVARLKFCQTSYGAWLDSVFDRYVDSLLILGLTWGCWRVAGDVVLVVGLLALMGSLGVSYTRARYEGAFSSPAPTGWGLPVKRDGRLFLIMVGALLNQVLATLAILAVLTNAEVVRRLVCWKASSRIPPAR